MQDKVRKSEEERRWAERSSRRNRNRNRELKSGYDTTLPFTGKHWNAKPLDEPWLVQRIFLFDFCNFSRFSSAALVRCRTIAANCTQIVKRGGASSRYVRVATPGTSGDGFIRMTILNWMRWIECPMNPLTNNNEIILILIVVVGCFTFVIKEKWVTVFFSSKISLTVFRIKSKAIITDRIISVQFFQMWRTMNENTWKTIYNKYMERNTNERKLNDRRV